MNKIGLWTALLTVVASGFWAMNRALPDERAAVTPKRETPTDRSQAGASAHGWPSLNRDGWPIGQQRSYTATTRSTWRNAGDSREPKTALEGEFDINVTASGMHGERKILRLDVRARRLALSGGAELEDLKPSFNRGAAQGVPVLMAPSGSFERIVLPDDLDTWTHGLLRQLAANLQVVLPGATPGPRWTSREHDMAGEYVARYERADVDLLHKRKVDYLSHVQGNMTQAREGRSVITLRDDGIPTRVRTDYDETLKVGDTTVTYAVHDNLSLIGVHTVAVEPPSLGAQAGIALSQGSTSKLYSRDYYEKLAKGHDVRSVLEGLQADDDPRERTSRMSILEAILRTRGQGAVQEAQTAVRELDDEDAVRYVIGAMEGAFTPEAQRALVDLARDPELGPERRTAVINQLGFGDDAVVGTLRELAEMASDDGFDEALQTSAELALGGAIRRADTEDPAVAEVAAEAVTRLSEQALHAQTRQTRITAVDALGNSGQASALPAIKTLLQDQDPVIRETSVAALRHLSGSDVDVMINDRLLSDDSSRVRRAAADTLRVRELTPDTRSALSEVIVSEPEVEVRQTAVNSAKVQLTRHPQLLDALAVAAERDSDEHIRASAAEAVASQGKVVTAPN